MTTPRFHPPSEIRGSAAAAHALRYRIGVDGGGTATRLRLCDAAGRLLAEARTGPSALGQGAAQAWRHVMQALEQAAARAGLSGLEPAQCAIGLGLSGFNVAALAREFLEHAPAFGLLVLDSDGFAGVLGAHGGGPGAVLIAGTGSVGEALRRDGSRACVGGWGWAIGDEGSGAWLGRQAVIHAQRALDGRDSAGTLASAVHAVCGNSREALLAWCTGAGQQGYASLAPLLFEQREIDAAAGRIVAAAVAELAAIVAALDPAGDLPLVLAGSIAERLDPLFAPALRARCIAPRGDAAEGALRLIDAALAASADTRMENPA